MSLFDGLHLYHIVLLVLGTLLFLVLLIMLVLSPKKRQLLPFFLVAILMIGFPMVKKIQFGSWMIETREETGEVARNPADTTARRALEANLADVEQWPIRTSSTLVTLAKAHEVLGDSVKALAFADSALQLKPNFQEAALLKERINTPRVREGVEVYKGVLKLSKNPNDTITRKELARKLPIVEKSLAKNPVNYFTLAKARAAIGDTTKALQLADSAQKYMVSNKQALQLKESILAKQRKER